MFEAGWCVGYPNSCGWGRGSPPSRVWGRAPGVRVRGRVLGGSPGSVGERRGGGGGSQSGQQVNGRSPSGPGSGGRDRARPAARRGGLGAGGERSQASASRRLRPRPRRSPGLEVGGVTRPGLERNRAHPAAGADRYWLCRLVSAPARSRIASFRTSTDKFT